MLTQEKATCALPPRHRNRKGVSILMGPMAILEATLYLFLIFAPGQDEITESRFTFPPATKK